MAELSPQRIAEIEEEERQRLLHEEEEAVRQQIRVTLQKERHQQELQSFRLHLGKNKNETFAYAFLIIVAATIICYALYTEGMEKAKRREGSYSLSSNSSMPPSPDAQLNFNIHAKIPEVGEIVTLSSDGKDRPLVYKSDTDLHEGIKASIANDVKGLQDLLDRGDAFWLENGTQVKVLDVSSPGSFETRILTGNHKDEKAFCTEVYFQTKTQ